MYIPTRLRIVEGRVVLDDGSDPTEYLKAFALRAGVSATTPICVVRSINAQSLLDDYDRRDYGYALAS